VLNHQQIFALSEEFRLLASLRPVVSPESTTVRANALSSPRTLEGPCLVLVKGLEEGRVFDLRGEAGRGEWLIGRRRGLAVSLDFDSFVSAENSRITLRDGTHELEDLSLSRNGTTVDFKALPKGVRRPLRNGDVIGVGRSLLVFRT